MVGERESEELEGHIARSMRLDKCGLSYLSGLACSSQVAGATTRCK